MAQGIKFAAFWGKVGRDGKQYWEGRLGGVTLRLFTNDYKKTDKQPDLVCYMSETPRDEQKQGRAPQAPISPQAPRQSPNPGLPPGGAVNAMKERVASNQKGQGFVDHTVREPDELNPPWPDEVPF